jgi:hypothetical protein
MNYYLVGFTYDHWNQGYEGVYETVLVKESTFDFACRSIKAKYENARDFKNLTIE